MKPTFDQFASFVRLRSRIPPSKNLTSGTQFEEDLGITGDDGIELLVAVEKEYGVAFESDDRSLRQTFNLQPNEYLFNGEGIPTLFRRFELTTIFSPAPDVVHRFTLGELYQVLLAIMDEYDSE